MAVRSNLWRTIISVPLMLARRRVVAGALTFAFVLIGSAVVMAVSGGSPLGSRVDAATTASHVPDPESVLDGRSPGQRRYGWLLNTKPDRLAFSPDDPASERVLSSTRHRPVDGGNFPVADMPVAFMGLVPDSIASSQDLVDAGLPGPIGGVGSAPIIGGIAGPGSGGGSGSVDPGTSAPGVSAVPEPASWAMMILGFSMLGAVLRRRRPSSIAATTR